MSIDNLAAAEAFSGHRFAEAYPHLADDLRWEAIGNLVLLGRDAAIAVCEQTLTGLAEVTVEVLRARSAGDDRAVAVDTLTRYTGADGQATVVSSCDYYTFVDDRIAAITSYTALVDEADVPSLLLGGAG